jgi:hypothetical protein
MLNSRAPALDGTVACFVSYVGKDEFGMFSVRWRRGALQEGDNVNRLLLIKKIYCLALVQLVFASRRVPEQGVAALLL